MPLQCPSCAVVIGTPDFEKGECLSCGRDLTIGSLADKEPKEPETLSKDQVISMLEDIMYPEPTKDVIKQLVNKKVRLAAAKVGIELEE